MDRRKLWLLLFLIWGIITHHNAIAQNYVFARLNGNPLNTTGWNLVGDATVGNTAGNPNPGVRDELILVDVQNNRSGAAFFNTPVNITYCQRWVAEFDYRIWGGSGADGIAFCFLANPPTGFVRGGGMGIPGNAQGLVIGLDPWNNANCNGQTNPELQIRYCTNGYSECPPGPAQPTIGPLSLIRQSNYNRMRIDYNNGRIEVYINNTLYLTGFYIINYAGYFGFTASTGGSTDQHSIKDFILYTYKPILSPPNAGNDITICSDTPSPLGIAPPLNDPYTYRWYPTTGLSDPSSANPTVTLSNPTRVPRQVTYFLTKDTLNGTDSVCAYSDAVTVTVLGKGAGAGPDLQLCSGIGQTINVAQVTGYSYVWAPSTGLSSAFRANPTIKITNNSDTAQRIRYILTATNSAIGCVDRDTMWVTVLPNAVNAGADRAVCSKSKVTLGTPAKPGYTYSWSPSTGLSANNIAQPELQLTNAGSSALTFTYILTAFSQSANCSQADTVRITLFPNTKVQAASADTIDYCNSTTNRLGLTQLPGTVYRWWPSNGLSDTNSARPFINLIPDSDTISFRKYYVRATNILSGCPGFDSVVIRVLPRFKSPFNSKDTVLCPNSLINLQAPLRQGLRYEWLYNNRVQSNLPTFRYIIPAGGVSGQIDTVILNRSLNGCDIKDTLLIRVKPDLIVDAGRSIGLCIGDSVQIGSSAQPGYTYSWSPSTGLNNPNLANPKLGIKATAPIAVQYILTAEKDGCEASDTLTVVLRVKPNSTLPNLLTICSNEPTRIPNFALSGYTYRWIDTIGLSNKNTADPIINLSTGLNQDSSLIYRVEVSDGLGCTITDTIGILLKGSHPIDMGGPQFVCPETPTPIGPPGNANYSYQWSPGWLVNDSTLAQPLFLTFNQTGSPIEYKFRVTTTYLPTGCKTYDTLIIQVPSKPLYQFPDTLKACSNKPLPIVLTIPQGFTPQWQANPLLDISNPIRPVFNTRLGSASQSFDIIRFNLSNGICQYQDSIVIHTQKSPDSIGIVGRAYACPGVQNSPYYLPNLPQGNTVQWFVYLGAIAGQSSIGDTVYINWGTLNADGIVRAVITNHSGCSSDTSIFYVRGGVIFVQKPIPVVSGDTLCFNTSQGRQYKVDNIPFSTFRWGISGGVIVGSSLGNTVIVNWNGPGIGKLWVEETSLTPLAVCTGVSDTLKILIIESPGTTNVLRGKTAFCAGETVWYSVPANPMRSRLIWQVMGGTLVSQTDDSVQVNWPAIGSGTITYQEIYVNGCAGTLINTNIRIDQKPVTLVVRSALEICVDSRFNQRYWVTYLNQIAGYNFNWTLVGGRFRSANSDSSSVWVDWDSLADERMLTVVLTVPSGCAAEPLVFRPEFISDFFKPSYVSTDETGKSTLYFEGEGASQALSLTRKRVQPKPEPNFSSPVRVAAPLITWTDSRGGQDTALYTWQASGFNRCGVARSFGSIQNLWLTGSRKIEGSRTSLFWNKPEGWLKSIKSYELWWKPEIGNWQLTGTYGATTLSADFENLPGGANQCFRIKALLSEDKEAWSNLICPEYRLNPEPANVFSPDGDGINDTWVIKNLDLYPDNTVLITDRWGREVYKAAPYKNDWKAESISSGTYFYLLTTPEGKKANGWLEILK